MQIEYDTIVIELEQILYIQQTPFQIIKESCDHYWSSYDGRRSSVVKHMKFQQKVPIPVSIKKAICLFPTHSAKHPDNSWVAYKHIAHFNKVVNNQADKPEQTKVIFKNGYTKNLDTSIHTFTKQWQRAFEVMYKSDMIEL